MIKADKNHTDVIHHADSDFTKFLILICVFVCTILSHVYYQHNQDI